MRYEREVGIPLREDADVLSAWEGAEPRRTGCGPGFRQLTVPYADCPQNLRVPFIIESHNPIPAADNIEA